MKKLKERILGLSLIISLCLAFLGYLMIRGALNNLDNYVSYFMLGLGIALILLFGIILLFAIRYSKKKQLKQKEEKLKIIHYGTKFTIDLDSVKIKSNKWDSSHFIENQVYDIEMKEKHLQTVLEFEIELNGQKKQFHWPCELDPKSLEMYFAIQKETNLYLDPANSEHFYLDLSFIK
ncbi:MAG: hypothetical protein K0S23_3365 [Fluviicola sp.]|jgi:hypothetical protein|uniref:hypothetical protein n=1 Tax=Fluviicola sp. TaxID=1917219 RepID=UPI00260269A8|nr:hypothetical protein [Fluviicola sp.]MDF3029058.1 hypothetical protein [Fluviicola sp.]